MAVLPSVPDPNIEDKKPSPEPASETKRRSRGLTQYLIFTHHENEWRQEGEVEARTPESACMDAVAKGHIGGADRVAVVPASAWHELTRTTTFKKADS